jgi:hypothetical protein
MCIHASQHVNIIPITLNGSDTAEARNYMTAMALDQKADWLLWLDADMTFPPETLIRLLNRGVPVVGADYRRRGPPHDRIALMLQPDDAPGPKNYEDGDGPSTGIVERAMLGLGVFLAHSEVFKKIEPPWFIRYWNLDHARPNNPWGFGTEDSFICARARAAGFQIWCDMDLSAEVGHLAEATVPFHLGAPK